MILLKFKDLLKINSYKNQMISKERGANYDKSINVFFLETPSMQYKCVL